MKELRQKIAVVAKEMAEKQSVVTDLKTELDVLAANNKNANPEIDSLDKKITALKEQKQKKVDEKTVKKTEIHNVEVEYLKLEQEINLMKELEEGKEKIRKEIIEVKEKIFNLQAEQSAFDDKVFDTLAFSVQKLVNSNSFNLPIDLVCSLMKYNIPIPKNKATAEASLEQLKEKKVSFG